MDNGVIFNHEFVAELLKSAKVSNVEHVDYNQMGIGLVEVRINFYVTKETLDKMLKEWYNVRT